MKKQQADELIKGGDCQRLLKIGPLEVWGKKRVKPFYNPELVAALQDLRTAILNTWLVQKLLLLLVRSAILSARLVKKLLRLYNRRGT